MEIKNEEHAKEMLEKWQQQHLPAQKREIRIALEKLELSSMYYEQKGNDKATERSQRCIGILEKYLNTLG